MTKPNFLLGVGAQKAGTSFLYRALSGHAEVALSTPKEMHVFDAYFMPEFSGHLRKRRIDTVHERLAAEEKALSPAAKRKTAGMLRHLLMYYDLGEYVRYFREIVEGRKLTGDITPSYSMLKAEHFAEIRDLLKNDFNVKVVFLMRDPIDRIFSAMRMDDRNLTRDKRESDKPAHERFSDTHSAPKHRRRTEYHKTIKALESVFPAADIHYEFYENLFNPKSFSDLLDFVGIKGLSPDFATRVNASPTKGKLTEQQIATARAFYDPTYKFCMDRFGAERVRALWPNA